MYWRRIRMIVITSALLFLAAKGAYDILRPPRAPAAAVTAGAQNVPVTPETRKGAENYAIYFTHFWLTGNLEEAKKYAAAGFDPPPFGEKPRKVENIVAWDMEPSGKEKVSVTIRALLDHNQVVYLAVPVIARQGRYGVIGLPTFIPEPKAAEAPEEEAAPAATDPADGQAVRSLVESFFRQYTEGTPQDLALLFRDGRPRRGLAPSLKAEFGGLESIRVSEPARGQLRAVARILLEVDGQPVPQTFEFLFSRSGDRWLIERTVPEIPRE